ncbi:MAG TPA: GvpL/GvpF family gas vesicle protein [Acidimicrobiales bacterium]|nr:GvpL/GvpF family gas vesicle protein [Acidimicrobiales bacterium]
MIDVYAVAAGPRRPPGVAGVEGSPVELLDHRALVVAVSRHAAAPPPTRAAALAHAAVCDELQALAEAVLPVRFGAVYADEPALRAALDERHADLAAGLDHVRGRVEVGVRVGWDPAGGDGDPAPSAPAPPATGAGGGGGPGRAYLLDRAAEERRRGARRERAERLAAAVHGAVAPLAADSRHRVLATDGLLLSAAYLVDRPGVDGLVVRARAVVAEHPGLALLCTGPWPPYHFAGVDGEVPGG